MLSGRFLTALICQYFDWAQLSHPLKVYLPECNLQKDASKTELRDFSNNNGYDINRNGDSVPLLLDVVEGFLEFENQSQGRDSGRRSVINSWGWWKVWGFETAKSRKQSFYTTFPEKLCWKNLGMSFEFVECGVVSAYLPDRVTNLLLQYLSNSISKAATYNLLQARVDVVLFEIIFPLMCFNENVQKLWEEEPHELEILLVIIMKIWDWDKEDELQMQNITPSSCASLATLKIETIVSNGEGF
ncbi:hypothetical protein L2E82_14374 [Cichorium intybus]|uniref:Uncharacterized protein n=1 Tax=Cichorium intybus TaxID=13427 RepID=A0ACB9F130_CICIN|nr:hypothetical protein L2E82_14374 [Cichorium intybus]